MTVLVENKKARLRFETLEEFDAGIELHGFEVKSLRNKLGNLEGARVVVRGGEAFLLGMTVPAFQLANAPKEYDPERTRRLLLNRKEIAELLDAETQKGLTVVPFSVYNKGRYLKVRIAIVRGKNKADRREDIKRLEAKKEADRAMRQK